MEITKKLLEEKIAELGSVEEVARYLGLSKSRLYVLVNRYGIETSGQNKVVLSKELLEQAVSDRKTVSDIADELQIAKSTVRRRMNEYGITPYNPQKERQIIDLDKCIEMLKNGCGNEEISEAFNCSVETVRVYIRNHNIKGYRKKKSIKEIIKAKSELTGEEGVLCEATLSCQTKKTCFYGGKCGGYDCCDYILMTGKQRKRDPKNQELCFCYVHASASEKREIANMKIEACRDVLIE